ncbi:hypothetical protein ACH4A8_17605 [Streptomyces vietnamensis]|uniref:hypothetical protein n=1 Tax=Streptomyces vietnamensis TaxID=362257 RepID=UPI0037BA082D
MASRGRTPTGTATRITSGARTLRPGSAPATAAAQAHAEERAAERAAGRTEALIPVGQLAHDTRREKRGVVMDHLDGSVWLRPVGGGTEWTAHPGDVQPLSGDSEQAEVLLRARVAGVNARSRGEVL